METLFRKSLAGLLALVFAQVAAIVMLFSPDHVRETVREESLAVERVFDADAAQFVFSLADGSYRRIFKDSGLEEKMLTVFRDIDAVDDGSGVLARLFRPVRPFLSDWFQTALLTGYLFLIRLGVAVLWSGAAGTLFLAGIVHGWLGRRIAQNNFDYVSPIRQKGALMLTLGTLYATAVLFVLPVTLSPFLVAGGMLLSGLMAGVLVRHIHKRI
jgi:hypothetical protein